MDLLMVLGGVAALLVSGGIVGALVTYVLETRSRRGQWKRDDELLGRADRRRDDLLVIEETRQRCVDTLDKLLALTDPTAALATPASDIVQSLGMGRFPRADVTVIGNHPAMAAYLRAIHALNKAFGRGLTPELTGHWSEATYAVISALRKQEERALAGDRILNLGPLNLSDAAPELLQDPMVRETLARRPRIDQAN